VIIPSRNRENLIACLRALSHNDPGARDITVVWDGGPNHGCLAGVRTLYGVQPFVYARNCNQGIRAAGNNDVVLLNDDAQLISQNGLSMMQLYAERHREIGLIGCVTRHAGNINQWPQNVGLRYEPRMVCFVCVYIPRRTIDLVGELDERFTGYGYDDDDYCVRVRRAGLKLAIADDCNVDHGSLTSTYRPAGPWSQCQTDDLLRRNLTLFVAKWGSLNV
jgi:GT2 family glycosyltransferase